MDERSRPPRVFGEQNELINFNFIPSMGIDLLKKYNLNKI